MDLGNYLPQRGKGRKFNVRLSLAILGILLTVVSVLYLFVPALRPALPLWAGGTGAGKNGAAAHGVKYLCPMHPFAAVDHPGACPICGMTLVAQEQAGPSKAMDCSLHLPAGVTLTPRQRVLANVALAKVAKREFSTETVAAGRVAWDERRLTRVSARIQGRVERLHTNFTGARISSGQPLRDIYSPDLLSTQREYLLALEGAERTAEGMSPESRAMMTGLRDAARSRLSLWGLSPQQIAELERSRQPKRVVTITSPATGVITERLVTAGQYVNEGAPLFSVGSLSTVWVFAELFENDLGRIAVGAPSVVTTEAFPGKLFQGRVAFVDPVINPETRTLKVRIDLDNSQGLLKPEMFVKVKLKSHKLRELAVPEGAVLFSGDRSMVWVESAPGAFTPRNITVGRKGDGYYEVISGLSGGESVAASGGFLIDGESQLQGAQPVAPALGKTP